MVTPALQALEIAFGDVDNLLEHHPKTGDPRRGRPTRDEGPLMRSCVLLAYAAWEVYAEDGVIWAVEQIARRANPHQLPAALRGFVAEKVLKDPWRLAGNSWRETTVQEVRKLAQGDLNGPFGVNTAGPGQIAKLHKKILGEQLLDKCRWTKKPTKKVKEDLAEFVKIRGSIAHTGQPLGPLHLRGVRDWHNFLRRLAANLDGHLEAWVAEHVPPD